MLSCYEIVLRPSVKPAEHPIVSEQLLLDRCPHHSVRKLRIHLDVVGIHPAAFVRALHMYHPDIVADITGATSEHAAIHDNRHHDPFGIRPISGLDFEPSCRSKTNRQHHRHSTEECANNPVGNPSRRLEDNKVVHDAQLNSFNERGHFCPSLSTTARTVS